MRGIKKRAIWMILVLTVLLCSACGTGQVAQKTGSEASKKTLRIGTNLALGTVTPYIAKEKGYFEESGLDVEIVEFSDGSSLMEAFAAGELDLGFVGVSPAATWAAKGIGLKIIASANGGGHVILTRGDTGIHSVADLKGKKIAEPNIGTVTDSLLRAKLLADEKLGQEDITAVSGMKPADMASILEVTKEVDAIITWEPYASQAQRTYKDIEVVYDAANEIKKESAKETFYPVNVVIASDDLIEKQPEKVKQFMVAYKKAVDYINQDSSADAMLASVLKLEKEVITEARKRVDFGYELDTESIRDVLQWSYTLEYLPSIPNDEDLFDLRFIKE